MPLDLPEPRTEKLRLSPLSLVVCQIRHEHKLEVADTRRALAVHEILRDRYPFMEEQTAQELALAAGPGGVHALPAQSSRGWRMRSENGGWTAVIMPDYFALETTKYEDWGDFSERLRSLATAVSDVIAPAFEQRVGMRMIDRIVRPEVTSPQGWRGLVDDYFLGPLGHPGIGDYIQATQHLLQLDGGDGRTVLLRHGFSPDPETSGSAYILDHDCFVQRGTTFKTDDTLTEVGALHYLACQVFQAAVTQKLYDLFEPL